MKLLHFTAEWCQPCKMMKPVIAQVTDEHPEIEYHSIDIDKHPETASDYRILSIPSFVLMDEDGEIKATVTGARTKALFEKELGL